MMKQIYPGTLIAKKKEGRRFTMLTAYDSVMASLLEKAGIEVILVGDSLGNVIAGEKNTIPVSMDQMILHTRYVSRSVSHALVITDMPFLSYEVSLDQAKLNAGRLIKEGGAHAIKLECHEMLVPTVKHIVDMGIPVMAHIGLTPQTVYKQGGFKIQGKDQEAFDRLFSLALSLEEAGCFSVLLECVPHDLASKITETLTIPTIGIGAGPHCDGQVLVSHDLLGLHEGRVPSFVMQYGSFFQPMLESVTRFNEDVISGAFPRS